MGLILKQKPSFIRPDIFPSAERARPDGLLAAGGNLSPEVLLAAYSLGIFPWYSENTPILWWSPDPRCLLFPDRFHISARSERKIRHSGYETTFNQAFDRVIENCAQIRRKDDGTWLVPEMIDAYKQLHFLGFAQSVETWQGNELVGGLYGICLGRAFFGESMFHERPEASRCALAALVREALALDFVFIDCQQNTPHMLKMGAEEVSRKKFLALLAEALAEPMDGC